jgi:hypothetical protein
VELGVKARLRRLERVVWAAIALAAVIFYLPALSLGPLADDLFQLAYVDGLLGPKSPFGLYFFALEDPENTAMLASKGALPWWTVPHFRFAHLRPLSSVLVWFDLAVLPRDSIWPHVHSLVWMVAMLAVIARVLVDTVGRRLAVIALLAFAIDEPMAWTVGWLANRCAIVSATFGWLALSVHIRRRRAPVSSPKLVVGETLLWLAAFAAGEYAISLVPIVLAWEIVERRGSLRSRVIALVPAATGAVAFVVAYVVIGCGVYGATTYVDPMSDPGTFVAELGNRMTRMAAEVFAGLCGESERLWIRYEWTGITPKLFEGVEFDPPARSRRHAWLAGAVLVVVASAVWALCRGWLRRRERRGVVALVWGSVIGLVPLAAIPPATRALLVPSVAGAVFFAVTVLVAIRVWRARAAMWRRIVVTLLSLVLAFEHVVSDAIFGRIQLRSLATVRDAHRDFFDSPQVHARDLTGKHVFVLAAPDLVTGIYGYATMDLVGRPVPASWHSLVMDTRRHLVRRIDPSTIELSAIGPAFHLDYQEALFRAPRDALQPGDKVDAGIFVAKVLRATDDEGPQAILFRFDLPLEDESFLFLDATPRGLEPFALPPVGETRVVNPPQIPRGLR